MDGSLLKIIGSTLRSVRIEKGLTQEQLAHICKTDASYVRKVESGRINISVNRLNDLANGLSIELSKLFKIVEDKTK